MTSLSSKRLWDQLPPCKSARSRYEPWKEAQARPALRYSTYSASAPFSFYPTFSPRSLHLRESSHTWFHFQNSQVTGICRGCGFPSIFKGQSRNEGTQMWGLRLLDLSGAYQHQKPWLFPTWSKVQWTRRDLSAKLRFEILGLELE